MWSLSCTLLELTVWFLEVKATLDKLYYNFREEDAIDRKCFSHLADHTNVLVLATICHARSV
jgi:hypothetical protein